MEPLIDQMTRECDCPYSPVNSPADCSLCTPELYADEWEDIISTEEQAYNETARGIGQVIDEGLVNIATKLGWVLALRPNFLLPC